jgi:hypothetical protein
VVLQDFQNPQVRLVKLDMHGKYRNGPEKWDGYFTQRPAKASFVTPRAASHR